MEGGDAFYIWVFKSINVEGSGGCTADFLGTEIKSNIAECKIHPSLKGVQEVESGEMELKFRLRVNLSLPLHHDTSDSLQISSHYWQDEKTAH